MTLQGETTYPAPTVSFVGALGAAQYAAEGLFEPRLPFGAGQLTLSSTVPPMSTA